MTNAQDFWDKSHENGVHDIDVIRIFDTGASGQVTPSYGAPRGALGLERGLIGS